VIPIISGHGFFAFGDYCMDYEEVFRQYFYPFLLKLLLGKIFIGPESWRNM
jgi:hypothetical protein